MLTFAGAEQVDRHTIHEVALIGDLFLDDAVCGRAALERLLGAVPPRTVLRSLRPVAALLFSHFCGVDPDQTVRDIAAMVHPIVVGVWGAPDAGKDDVVWWAGRLIANDFNVEGYDAGCVRYADTEVARGVAIWVVSMSVALAHLDEVPSDGGDPVRWWADATMRPDPLSRVVVGGATE